MSGNFISQIADATRKIFEDRKIGETFWLSTSILADALGASGTLSITERSTRGDLVIEDVIIKTGDGFGGTGTFKITATNTKGTTVFFEEGIGLLGSSATVDLASTRLREMFRISDDTDPAVILSRAALNTRTVLEEGQRIELDLSGAGTGEGDVDIFIQFRRLALDANVKLKS